MSANTDVWPPTGRRLPPRPLYSGTPAQEIPFLVNAIKVLTEQVEDLQGQIDALKEAVGRIYQEGMRDGRLGR